MVNHQRMIGVIFTARDSRDNRYSITRTSTNGAIRYRLTINVPGGELHQQYYDDLSAAFAQVTDFLTDLEALDRKAN